MTAMWRHLLKSGGGAPETSPSRTSSPSRRHVLPSGTAGPAWVRWGWGVGEGGVGGVGRDKMAARLVKDDGGNAMRKSKS